MFYLARFSGHVHEARHFLLMIHVADSPKRLIPSNCYNSGIILDDHIVGNSNYSLLLAPLAANPKKFILTIMAFTPLTVPSIEEGSSLLRSYALDKIREHYEALVFHYESHPHRKSQDASNNASNNDSEVDVQPEKTGMVAKLANGQLQLYDHSSPQRIIPLYLPPVGAVPYVVTHCLLGLLIGD